LARKKKPSGVKQKHGRPRTVRELHRKPGRKSPNKTIVVLCEGKKTEPNYFHSIRREYRLPSLNVQILPEKGAPTGLVKEAIREKRRLNDNRDEVWCVFDVEQETNKPIFRKAIAVARAADINLAVSNPSFEYWYLIHFERTDRPFLNAKDVIEQLVRHLPDYEKNAHVYSKLKDRTAMAIQNAGYLRNCADQPWNEFPNPSTTVDSLVTNIRNMRQ